MFFKKKNLTSPDDASMDSMMDSLRKAITDDGVAPNDDVLTLTQVVGDDGVVSDLAPTPPTPPTPTQSPQSFQMPDSTSSLLSDKTEAVTLSAFSGLAEKVAEKIAKEQVAFLNNGKTIEGLVSELLRPMMGEWLDKNLPDMVERIVQKEIENISRQSQL